MLERQKLLREIKLEKRNKFSFQPILDLIPFTRKDSEEKKLKSTKPKEEAVWKLLMHNRLSKMPLVTFLLVSGTIGIAAAIFYQKTIRTPLLSIAAFFLGFFFFYSSQSTNWYFAYKVDEKLAYQEFIEGLQTEFSATSSMLTIFRNLLDKGVHSSLQPILKEFIKNIQLSNSTEAALVRCEKMSSDPIIKNIFIILRINYSQGSNAMIESLDVFKKDYETTIQSIIELKNVVSGHLSDKTLFMALSFAVPAVVTGMNPEYFVTLFSYSFGVPLTIGILCIPFLGSLIVDKQLIALTKVI